MRPTPHSGGPHTAPGRDQNGLLREQAGLSTMVGRVAATPASKCPMRWHTGRSQYLRIARGEVPRARSYASLAREKSRFPLSETDANARWAEPNPAQDRGPRCASACVSSKPSRTAAGVSASPAALTKAIDRPANAERIVRIQVHCFRVRGNRRWEGLLLRVSTSPPWAAQIRIGSGGLRVPPTSTLAATSPRRVTFSTIATAVAISV